MDFGFNERDKAFPMEVRDFIQANMTPTIKFSLANDGLLNTPKRREFIGRMVPKGWLSMGFPEKYGGMAVATRWRNIFSTRYCNIINKVSSLPRSWGWMV